MSRWLFASVLLAILAAGAIWSAGWLFRQALPPIRVGILHSEHGPMAISEKSMIDGEKLASRRDQQALVSWVARSNGLLPTDDQTGRHLPTKPSG